MLNQRLLAVNLIKKPTEFAQQLSAFHVQMLGCTGKTTALTGCPCILEPHTEWIPKKTQQTLHNMLEDKPYASLIPYNRAWSCRTCSLSSGSGPATSTCGATSLMDKDATGPAGMPQSSRQALSCAPLEAYTIRPNPTHA